MLAYRDRCGGSWENQDESIVFHINSTVVFTVGLVLSGWERGC